VVLSADGKGYSCLMSEDEIGTVRMLTAHRTLMRDAVARLHGRVVDTPGDNLLAEFAMHCALYVDGSAVAAADLARTAPVCFALAGEGLCCGFDDGTPVSEDYESTFDFTGVIDEVVIDVGGTPVLDLEMQVRRAWVTQ